MFSRPKYKKLAIQNIPKYIATMRKLIALCMSCTLLFISSMPTVALASVCDMPDYSAVSLADKAEKQAATTSMQHHQNMKHHVVIHRHKVSKDWQTCRIECGCGCHRHIDSLPHLLSPHVISQVAELPRLPALAVAEAILRFDYFYIAPVQLPPPDLS